jgi:hypothetical protein
MNIFMKQLRLFYILRRELRSPLVASLRAIGPTKAEDVVNPLVDYPQIWVWLLAVVSVIRYLVIDFVIRDVPKAKSTLNFTHARKFIGVIYQVFREFVKGTCLKTSAG